MFKKRRKLKTIISVVLVLGLSAGIVGGIVALSRKDTETISSTAFTRGDLDSNGRYVESNQAIYTKEAFYCQGLRIVPDFESKVTYDVYYYDYNDILLECIIGLSGVYDEDYPLAKTARIVIHPEIPNDVKASDFKINFWEVVGYADDLKITVDKKQVLYESGNLYDDSKVETGKIVDKSAIGSEVVFAENEYGNLYTLDNITDEYSFYDIFIEKPQSVSVRSVSVLTLSDSGIIVYCDSFDNMGDLKTGDYIKLTIELPNDFKSGSLIVSMAANANCHIYGYNK